MEREAKALLALLLWLAMIVAAWQLTGCGYSSAGWEVVWPGKPAFREEHVRLLIDVTEREYPCVPRSPALVGHGRIEFRAEPFPCGPFAQSEVAGCFDPQDLGAPFFVVALSRPGGEPFEYLVDTALIHELGHWGWTICGRISYLEDGSHPEEFLAWVNSVHGKANDVGGLTWVRVE